MNILHDTKEIFVWSKEIMSSQSDCKLGIYMEIVKMAQEIRNREKAQKQTCKRALMETLKMGKRTSNDKESGRDA